MPIHSAVCPCCASTLVELARANGHAFAPFAWACVHCGFTLMGLAVPIEPYAWKRAGRQYTCLEVTEAMAILGNGPPSAVPMNIQQGRDV